MFVCPPAGYDDISDCIDLIICLGGDGTLLYASSLFQVTKSSGSHRTQASQYSFMSLDDYKMETTLCLSFSVFLPLSNESNELWMQM